MITVQDIAAKGRTQRLAALPTAPRVARVFVVQLVREWGLPEQCIETAELLASELVTNAVKQTGRTSGTPMPGPTEHVAVVSVWLHVVEDVLRIEVWDNDAAPPRKKELDPDTESGRGLFLVEALSKRWGVYNPKVGGKVVWCEVEIEVSASSATAEVGPSRTLQSQVVP